jgi:hypothetical protein
MITSIANNTTAPPTTGSFDVNVLLTGLGALRRTAPLVPSPPAKHVVLEEQVMLKINPPEPFCP